MHTVVSQQIVTLGNVFKTVAVNVSVRKQPCSTSVTVTVNGVVLKTACEIPEAEEPVLHKIFGGKVAVSVTLIFTVEPAQTIVSQQAVTDNFTKGMLSKRMFKPVKLLPSPPG